MLLPARVLGQRRERRVGGGRQAGEEARGVVRGYGVGAKRGRCRNEQQAGDGGDHRSTLKHVCELTWALQTRNIRVCDR